MQRSRKDASILGLAELGGRGLPPLLCPTGLREAGSPPSFPPPHRQCSSEPNITDSPEEPEQVAAGSQEDSELNCASLS